MGRDRDTDQSLQEGWNRSFDWDNNKLYVEPLGSDGSALYRLSVDNTGKLNVNVVASVPGTGAEDLGKARSSTAGATDTGVAMLGLHAADNVAIEEATGEYAIPHISDLGALEVEPEQHHVIDEMDSTTDWAVLSDSADTLVADLNHVVGSHSLSFDKVNGSGSTLGGIDKTIDAIDLGDVSPHDIIQVVSFVSSITNIDYIFIRVGTDASNYNEWRIPVASLAEGEWESIIFEIGDASKAGATGNGVNWNAITYVAVGYNFNGESNTLSGILFDQLSFHTNQHVNATIGAEVTSTVSSANVNLQKIKGSPTDKGSGNIGNGTQRIVIATDDINMAAIKTAVEATLSVKSEKASSAGTSTGVSVGSSTTTVLASNASRKAAIIVNDSDETIYLKYGATATSNSGIRLNANGGLVREELYTGVINGICASGSKVVTVTEL